MKKLLLALTVIGMFFFPLVSSAASDQCVIEEQKVADQLFSMGVYIFGNPYPWQLDETLSLLKQVDKADGLIISYEPGYTFCPNAEFMVYGCADTQITKTTSAHPKGVRIIRISASLHPEMFRKVFMHEYAHSIGIENEDKAWAFSNDFFINEYLKNKK